MLPYSPLHHLLLADFANCSRGVAVLVLTSGNLTDEPIAFDDAEALQRLGGIADFFLTHDRPIQTRVDDSVIRVAARSVPDGSEPGSSGSIPTVMLRRSRGYAPEPIALAFEFPAPVLACGAHLKNTFCLGKGRQAFLSHHIGDLENYETLRSFTEGIAHFERLFDVEPTVVAHDLHPEYLATKYAQDRGNVQRIGVQHHHAHVASVLAEHGLDGRVIGVAFDGTGLGLDGHIWGGEFLIADRADFDRVAHFTYMPLPGGEQAIRHPWRIAAAYLDHVYGEDLLTLPIPFVRDLDRSTWRILRRMIESNVNSPHASSVGRLFDAVAALVTSRRAVAYEGQAAVELEMLADVACQEKYDFALSGNDFLVVEPETVIRSVVEDLQRGVSPATIAARFHNAVTAVSLLVCERLRERYGLNRVALSGGVFQNALLLERLVDRLDEAGFEVFTNRRVPPNDGGISLGQAVVAGARTGGQLCV